MATMMMSHLEQCLAHVRRSGQLYHFLRRVRRVDATAMSDHPSILMNRLRGLELPIRIGPKESAAVQ